MHASNFRKTSLVEPERGRKARAYEVILASCASVHSLMMVRNRFTALALTKECGAPDLRNLNARSFSIVLSSRSQP